uniref:hypothetical protein n=1 Tax=Nonomuraea sp. CA-252377 TaxID=3240003 RepID=UPI003F49B1FC
MLNAILLAMNQNFPTGLDKEGASRGKPSPLASDGAHAGDPPTSQPPSAAEGSARARSEPSQQPPR